MQIVKLGSFLAVAVFPSTAWAWMPALFPTRGAEQSQSKSQNNRNSRSRLNMSVPNALDTLTSGLASMARIQFGVEVEVPNPTNDNIAPYMEDTSSPGIVRIEALYDLESSRECRLVRERVTELDLIIERVIPYAANSRVATDPNHEFALRDMNLEIGVPLMIISVLESNGGLQEKRLVGSEEILDFLDETFGNPTESTGHSKNSGGEENAVKELVVLTQTLAKVVGSYLPSLLRLGRGNSVASCATNPNTPRPDKPLILYSYEGNQFCRLVREVLCELDIVYELRSAGKGSPRREELAELTGGSTQCPYIIDPNTGAQMAESKDIIEYLYENYSKWTPPDELLQSASAIITPIAKPLFDILAPLQAGSYKKDKLEYELSIKSAKSTIEIETSSDAVVVYTYRLSPFCSEATSLLDRLEIPYTEISLGLEWVPGLIDADGSPKRAALGEITGQTSLPNVFVGGESIGGLFSGTPGLIPLLENDELQRKVEEAQGLTKGQFDMRAQQFEGAVGSFE